MTEKLPITLHVSDELANQYQTFTAKCNKLEAMLNFQTLTASWYGDEEKVLSIQIYLLTPSDFFNHSSPKTNKKAHNLKEDNSSIITQLSDDVLIETYENDLLIKTYISITESEQELLNQHEKILINFTEKKLKKVLNSIAKIRHLSEI